jgi:hypothetical protein
VEGRDFLLDLDGGDVSNDELKVMIVDAMNLARAEAIVIYQKQVVRRGEHDDA